MLGDLDLVELERAQRLAEQDHPGDDRRRAVGMQADDRAPARFVHVGQAREQQFDRRQLEPVAVHARGVVGVELLGDRGGRGGGAGDGDAARDRGALVRPAARRGRSRARRWRSAAAPRGGRV